MNDTSNTATTLLRNSTVYLIQQRYGVEVWWIRCLGLAGLFLNVILFLALVLSLSCSPSSGETPKGPTGTSSQSPSGNSETRNDASVVTLCVERESSLNTKSLCTRNDTRDEIDSWLLELSFRGMSFGNY